MSSWPSVKRGRFSDRQIAAIRRDGATLGVRVAARKHQCSAAYVSDLMRGKRRPAPLVVRALAHRHYEASTGRLWRSEFWSGDGSPATVPCVVLTTADYRALRRKAGAK